MVTTVSWRKGVNLSSFACQHRGVLTEDFERTRAILRGNDEGLLAHVDLIFSMGSIGFPEACPLRPFLWRMRDGSAQGEGAAQYVGRQVEVVCNTFGCDASFSDLDLGHPGEPDPWRLAPELKFLMRPQLHWAFQEESELAPTDRSCTGESVPQEIEVFVQRPAIETSDERISEPIARGGRIEDLLQVGLRPTFDRNRRTRRHSRTRAYDLNLASDILCRALSLR